MYIGSLTDKNSPVSVSYYYTARGLSNPLFPTLLCEDEEKKSYGIDGKLFSDFVGFAGTSIGESGVDIHFVFDRECYVDNIEFEHKIFSQIKDITVYSVTGEETRAVGKHHGEYGRNISASKDGVQIHADGTVIYDESCADETETITVSIGINSKHLIMRLDADYLHIAIGALKIFGATDLEEAVYPIPQSMNIGKEVLKNITGVSAECDEAKAGADYFVDGWEKASLSSNGNVRFMFKKMDNEAFEIDVNADGAFVYSSSVRGFVYAAAKLLQLCTDEGIKFAGIKDAPSMEVRGAHVALPAREDLEFFKRLIKYVYVPFGYNTVILQISALMEYKRHPEINKAWVEAVENFKKGLWPCPAHYGFLGDKPFTHDEIRELCAYIRSFGLEIAAEIQSFGHVQYITMAYPHLAEPEYDDTADGDEYGADERPSSFYHHCMCPSHEDYYKIFFDIIDEVCEVIKPEKYIHIGHDEIYTYGKCKKCREIPLEKLFADEVTKLHDYIASKGLRTMMWSDMIVKETYSIPGAIELIPKDIICLPFTWYFHLNENTEQILKDHGFEFVIGNFYSSHYPRFTERKTTPGWKGAQVSAWVRCCEEIYCYEGKIFEFVYSSNMMWNAFAYQENMRNTYTVLSNKMISDVMKKLRNNNAEFATAKKLEITKNTDAVPCDIRHEVDGAIITRIGKTTDIPLNVTSQNLWIVSSTDKNGGRKPWQKLNAMGSYRLNYSDGTSTQLPIYYGVDVAEYNRGYAKPLSSPLFRHEGYLATCYSEPIMSKTFEGKDYVLFARPVKNPCPEKTIESVTVTHNGNTDASIIVYDIFAE